MILACRSPQFQGFDAGQVLSETTLTICRSLAVPSLVVLSSARAITKTKPESGYKLLV